MFIWITMTVNIAKKNIRLISDIACIQYKNLTFEKQAIIKTSGQNFIFSLHFILFFYYSFCFLLLRFVTSHPYSIQTVRSRVSHLNHPDAH